MTGTTMESISCYQTQSMLVTDADIIECTADESTDAIKSCQTMMRL